MNERDAVVEQIGRSGEASRPEVAGLLGLWHYDRKEYPASFLAFSTALNVHSVLGFFAVSAWRAEWGAKPLPADFVAQAPLASACFWAWAGKPEEGWRALEKESEEESKKARPFLEVYLKLLSLPSGPSHRPPEFRGRLEVVLKSLYGVASEITHQLLGRYDSGDLPGVLAGLRASLEEFFVVPAFTSIDYLWLLFLSGIGSLDFASIATALSELESLKTVPTPGWQEKKQAAGYLLLYFFLLRAGVESFEKALAINPHFERAAKNAQLMKREKPELVELIKRFSVF